MVNPDGAVADGIFVPVAGITSSAGRHGTIEVVVAVDVPKNDGKEGSAVRPTDVSVHVVPVPSVFSKNRNSLLDAAIISTSVSPVPKSMGFPEN